MMRIVSSFILQDDLEIQYYQSGSQIASTPAPFVAATISIPKGTSMFPLNTETIEGVEYKGLLDEIYRQFDIANSASASPIFWELRDKFVYDHERGQFYIGGFYTGTASGSAIELVGSITLNAEARRVLGAQYSTWSNPFLATGSHPLYLWESTEKCWSDYSSIFELDVPYRDSETDDGRTFGLSADGKSNFTNARWKFMNEPQWNVFSYRSSSIDPYPIQEHIKTVRSYRPWLVYHKPSASNHVVDGNLSPDISMSSIETYDVFTASYDQRVMTAKYLGDEAFFRPTPLFPDMYNHWNVPFEVKVLSFGISSGL